MPGTAVNPAVQIDESFLQPGFILLPPYPIDSRRGLTLQCVEAVAKKGDAEVVE